MALHIFHCDVVRVIVGSLLVGVIYVLQGCGGQTDGDVDGNSTSSTPSPPSEPERSSSPAADVYEYVGSPLVGEWGGKCRCPSGQVYEVGDNQDSCGSLACVGGEVVEACGEGVISSARAGWRVTCRGGAQEAPPVPPGIGSGGKAVKFLEWNVHWQNKDTLGLANVIIQNNPDIIGLCEFTADINSLTNHLNVRSLSRVYQAQPGHDGYVGYGTDIWFDSNKWTALEGGKRVVHCQGHTQGGSRAANYVVLRGNATGQLLITGGIHLSYCAGSWDCKINAQYCEARKFYEEVESMRVKYPGAKVVWMGDLNEAPNQGVLRELDQGTIGFPVDDVSQSESPTHMEGGIIDYILAEKGAFVRVGGGSTEQGRRGSRLNNADHYPVYAVLEWRNY